MMIDQNDLDHRFSLQPANTDTKRATHEAVRSACGNLAFQLNELVPDGREKSLAITNLEQAMFWANAGIARYGTAGD